VLLDDLDDVAVLAVDMDIDADVLVSATVVGGVAAMRFRLRDPFAQL
jgi:hypothetical protein